MPYFLLGMPGSGKSYWGKIWATETGLDFFDLDHYIVKKEQLTIPQIFEVKGEKSFRNLESHYLKELTKRNQKCIIACGGGTPCFNNNMDFINQNGISIFLNTDIENISYNLLRQKEVAKRPLFKTLQTKSDVKNYLEDLLNNRISYYKKARYEIIPGFKNDTLKILKNLPEA